MTVFGRMETRNLILSWVLAVRPKTLIATLAPILVASSIAYFVLKQENKHFIWWISIFSFLSALCIQIATNLINDALDFKKGADNQDRIGPKRMSSEGMLKYKHVLSGGLLFLLFALLLGIPLVIVGGLPILILGLTACSLGYLYTGGPFPIAYHGLGEFFVLVFYGIVPVLGVHYLHTGYIGEIPFVAGLQMGALATVLICINNFRDIYTDRKARKITLAARFGETFARIEISFLFLFSYVLCYYWYSHRYYFVAFLPFLTLPLCAKVIYGLFKNSPSAIFNKYLGLSAANQLLFGILMLIGLILN